MEVIRQARLLLDQGFREITLTGIHLGGYGRDSSQKETLAQLAQQLLKEERLERLRLSSIEPLEYTDKLIDLVAESPKMAKHFHVPLHWQPSGELSHTVDHVLGLLKLLQAQPQLCSHLEMETYTWAVMPELLHSPDVVDQLVGEYEWTLRQFVEHGLH